MADSAPQALCADGVFAVLPCFVNTVGEILHSGSVIPCLHVGAETAPSAETEALEREELRNLAEQKQILLLALLSLKDTDRELINALFFDGASTREYAQRMGVSQRAVIKRRDRILRDLKKFFENSSK